jgi:hypothetical protein
VPLENQTDSQAAPSSLVASHGEQEQYIMMSEEEQRALDEMLDRGLLILERMDQDALYSIERLDTLQGRNVEAGVDFETVQQFEAAVAQLKDLTSQEASMVQCTKMIIEERITHKSPTKEELKKTIFIEPDDTVRQQMLDDFA